ncbi:hypothetical protein LTR37_006872 [Vermiconidia calcicola]|uniref:Uncharacterized protein n=1 Tax=Vermiconidia calcicola TaxID=1690605 RepID=A0ACC3NGY8_9PEZI|nr:hypothetical protein LTR37_006872 [Vermiconidia calcicola]
MNRFRTKKKTLEPLGSNDEALNALSAQWAPTSPGLKKSATSRWKRSKKPVEEIKPEINVTAVLPTNDDFRTSLLMPNLSARFSMLREQDDPNSLLGKASDDSVLQPRRRSRMDFGGLGDIAEVSSIRSQVRPPFAPGRQDSFASEDGYMSENDTSLGMMSRARPGEGNVLFGGRQKVYMIPKAGSSSSRSLGKVRYEDDIGMSRYQKYKREMEQEAQEGRVSDESQSFDFGLDQTGPGDQYDGHEATPNDSAKDLSQSPSRTSSEKNRSTHSTSHSESRSSTAATSVASQVATSAPAAPSQPAGPPPAAAPPMLKRQDTKTRRLYEQGLDQHMHDQQTSAITRLNSIQRQRAFNGGKQPAPLLQSTKSASNLHDRVRPPVYAVRPQSPEMASAAMNKFGSIRIPVSNTSSPNPSGPASPLTPHGMDLDEGSALIQALEPGDRGKATAMGAFNKPKQFDEQQYLERQRQLQRSTSSAANRREPPAPSAVQQRLGRLEADRGRSDSDASARSRSRSRSRSAPKATEATNAYNVFQRAAQMNTRPGAPQPEKSTLPDTHRTFFGNISASDSEEEEEERPRYNQHTYKSSDYQYGAHHGRWQPSVLPSVSEHPALRSRKSKASLAEEDEDVEPTPLPAMPLAKTLHQNATTVGGVHEEVDSPTLPAGTSSTPLNGLMHHLRQQSNVSSIFPSEDRPSPNEVPELPEWNPKNLDLVHPSVRSPIESDTHVDSTHTSNPWDLDEVDSTSRAEDLLSRASVSPLEEPRALTQDDSRAPSRATNRNRQSVVSELEPEHENEGTWQSELQKQHTRDPSTATQQEREAFENELAARRTAIQEKMKRNNQSRNASPAPSASGGNGFKGFGMLRSRPSRESIDNGPRAQAPPKAMKMLGINGPATNTSSNASNPQYERGGYSFDTARQRDDPAARVPSKPSMPPRVLPQVEQEARREWQQSRSRENSESRPVMPPPNTRSPASSAGGRSRANSEATTGRSRSRTGPYRDDLEKAMVEGTGSGAAGVPEPSPMMPRELTPRPSPDNVQGPFDSSRARTNSRAAMTSYFDPKIVQTGSRERLAPGGPMPVTLSPNVYSPGLHSARPPPSPASPFAQNMTPPISGHNTPVSSNFNPSPQPPPSGRPSNVLRKKTISKHDISEPKLMSSTSNIDTVELPEGASLKNGMNEAPPLPPINPRRRTTKVMFGLGRKDSDESTASIGSRSKTPDPWMGMASPEPAFPFEASRANRSGSESRSPRIPMPKQSLDYSPALRQQGFATNAGSPERMGRPAGPPHPVTMEGGMF